MSHFLIALAASGLIQAARPAPPADWLANFEYPKQALQTGERGNILLRVVISPTGIPVRCDPHAQTVLNKAACRQVMAGHEFVPATDPQGQPAYGVYNLRGQFTIPGTTDLPRTSNSDILLTVDQLPDGIPDPSYALILFTVTVTGKIDQCFPRQWEKAQPEAVATFLGGIACSEMAKSAIEPARDTAGKTVPSVQKSIVKFATLPATGVKGR